MCKKSHAHKYINRSLTIIPTAIKKIPFEKKIQTDTTIYNKFSLVKNRKP